MYNFLEDAEQNIAMKWNIVTLKKQTSAFEITWTSTITIFKKHFSLRQSLDWVSNTITYYVV